MTFIPALCVAVLCTWFALLVGRQFATKLRLNLFFWFASLVLSAAGSLAYCVVVWTMPHSAAAFRLYYLFGALWMAAVMGLGSLALVFHRAVVLTITTLVLLALIYASVLLIHAPVNAHNLSALDGGAGVGVLSASGTLVALIASLNAFGALCVWGVALWSAWQARKRHVPGRFFRGNMWVALGVLVISAAGSAARLGWPGLFWTTMFLGWVITFVGYRGLTPRTQSRAMVREAQS